MTVVPLPSATHENGAIGRPVGLALEALRQQREMRAHRRQHRPAVDRVGVAHARAVALVDVAGLLQALQDRPHLGVGVVDHRGAVLRRRRAVRQHAGGEALERIAVLAVGLLHLLVEVLGERGLEVIDRRHVEHVEPHHRLLAGIAVVVRRPVGGDDEVAVVHHRLLALDRGVGALAFQHETDGRGRVAVYVGDLAGQDELDAGEQRMGNARLAGLAGIFQDQHAALGFLGADHVARLEHQPLDVGELPDRRPAGGLRLGRHQVLEHLPEWRQVELGDLVVIGMPRDLHVVLGAGL